MTWLKLPHDTATPELTNASRRWNDQGRPVPAVLAPMKLNLRAMRSVMLMNSAVTFGGSSLGRALEERVAVTVSALNECFY
tara:strand:- start:49 stop:291 length:243 start_codon:yes stop_codon:yes gene_type:complete